MLSGLANDHEPDAMSDLDQQITGVLLLIAGHETTVNLIANGTLTLLRNPGALARLRREPGCGEAARSDGFARPGAPHRRR
jgi:cytochrome P450